jgi:hypothetical protein
MDLVLCSYFSLAIHIFIILCNIFIFYKHTSLNCYVIFHGCATPFPVGEYCRCLNILNTFTVFSVEIMELVSG